MSARQITAEQRLLLLGMMHDAGAAAQHAGRVFKLADGSVPDTLVDLLERDLVRVIVTTQKLMASGLVRADQLNTAWAISA